MTENTFTKNIFLKSIFSLVVFTQIALGSAAIGEVEETPLATQTSTRWVVGSDPADTLSKVEHSLDEGEIEDLTVRAESMNGQVEDLLNFIVEGTFSGLKKFSLSFTENQLIAESTIHSAEEAHSYYYITRGFDNRETVFHDDPHRALAQHLLKNYTEPSSSGNLIKSARKS